MSVRNYTPDRHSVRRSSLRTSLFFETFGLLALTVLSISVVAFFLSWNELKIRTTSQLQSIAEGKEALLESTIVRQREQLSILGRDTTLRGLPSVTALVGFQQLLRIDASGNSTILAGERTPPSFEKSFLASMRGREGTVFSPVVTEAGWTTYIVAAPQMSGTTRVGTLIATFDASTLASRLLHTDSAAKTTEVLLATTFGDEEIILRADNGTDHVVPVLDAGHGTMSVVREALSGKEGVADTRDYSGIPVLAAYRSIPALGWVVIAKLDLYEVQAPTLRLATNLAGTGLMIIVFLSLSTFFLGRRIVGPLEELTNKLDGLETKRWRFARSIFTGNELEIVDAAADQLTQRLRASHEHLESLVAERTKEMRKKYAEDAAILESMADGLVVTNASGMITYANPMAESLAGRKDAIGRPIRDFLPVAGKEGVILDDGQHPILSVLTTRSAFRPRVDPQLTLTKPDGSVTAIQLRVTPILKGKQCIGAIAVLRDTTEERRIDRMKSEFITLVSHQLRTPLSSMRWYLEMLIAEDAGPLSDDQREYVEQAATSNSRMVHLVNALLNVSRIELGTFQLSPEPIDLQKLVKEVAASFDLESKQKKIRFAYDLPTNNIGVRSDKNLLQLILENFMSNAIKYSHPESIITINLREDKKTGHAIFSVTDTGIGIPESQKQNIGRKLFRGSNAAATDTDGNGLGVYISQTASDMIGAMLSFESSEGKGTTFSLRVPMDPKRESGKV